MKSFIVVYIFKMVSDNGANNTDIQKSLPDDLKKVTPDGLKVEQELDKKNKLKTKQLGCWHPVGVSTEAEQ